MSEVVKLLAWRGACSGKAVLFEIAGVGNAFTRSALLVAQSGVLVEKNSVRGLADTHTPPATVRAERASFMYDLRSCGVWLNVLESLERAVARASGDSNKRRRTTRCVC